MRALGILLMTTALFTGCGEGCDPGGTDGGPSDGPARVVGRLALDTSGGDGGRSLELRLAGLEQGVRALQVDVRVTGSRAQAIVAAGDVLYDVVEGGLGEPQSTFRAVVTDSRRIPLGNGVFARVAFEGDPSTVELDDAIAATVDGNRLILQTEVEE